MLRHHQRYFAQGLTVVCTGCALFVSGLVIGQLTDPAPGILGGMPLLSWFIPLLVTAAVVVPLAKTNGSQRWPARAMKARGRPALVEGSPQFSAEHAPGVIEVRASERGSALGLFPEESPVPGAVRAGHTCRPHGLERAAS